MKLRLLSFALAIALMGVFTVGAAAQPTNSGPQQAAVAGVVNAIIQLIATDVIDIDDTTVQVGLVNVSKSLNSLRILNNSLNNNEVLKNFLNNNDIDLTIKDVNVLSIDESNVLNNFLNENDIDINSVVGVGVLSTGDLIVFQR